MLPDNIESKVKNIIALKGDHGWIRSQECALAYAKDATGKINPSEKVKFYRWRKQVEKGKVDGFQAKTLAGNIAYVGLSSADPRVLDPSASGDKRFERSIKPKFGFFEWLKYRDERERKQIDENIAQIQCRIEAHEALEDMKLWTDDPEYHKKVEEVKERYRKKYGLPYFPGP